MFMPLNMFGILFIFCPSKQATRPSRLLDWEMANCAVVHGQLPKKTTVFYCLYSIEIPALFFREAVRHHRLL